MNLYRKTALIDMLTNEENGRSVKFKMEAYQPSSSFKLRGMEFLCKDAIASGATHLISSSGGNAGLSAAYVGRKLGVEVTVVLPKSTPDFIFKKLEEEGAKTIVYGDAWDEANNYALTLTEEEGTAYIPPFDHPKLWEGHSTIVDELNEECKVQPDLIILSVGGGGLLCGVVEGLIRNNWTDTHVLAVETEGSASLAGSIKAKELITLDKIDTIATSLGAKKVAEKALEYSLNYNVIPYIVTDHAATSACAKFADEFRTLVEPACGASISAIYDNPEFMSTYKNIVVIVCGGAKVELKEILAWQK
jgi:L-serine/L-threonine ammonia-lyase